MARFKDITGRRFGSLVALRRIGVANRSSLWEYQCDCGKLKTSSTVRPSKPNQSCGCKKPKPPLQKPKPPKTHCKCGHKLDEANTYIYASGERTCKICEKNRVRKYRTHKT